MRHDLTVREFAYEGWSWSCDTCNKMELRLPSSQFAYKDHAQYVRQQQRAADHDD